MMKEKEIIRCDNKKITKKIPKIIFILLTIAIISTIVSIYGFNYMHEASEMSGSSAQYYDLAVETYPNWGFWSRMEIVNIFLPTISWIFSISLIIFFLVVRKMELVITNKRVYGKTIFGKRVDLPIDSISSVGMCMFSGIFIATSSGKIKFLLMKNKDELHKVISDLIMERQEKKSIIKLDDNIDKYTNADELKKYKELLDSGVISQEEFDAKKKQLLGL